MVWQVLEDVAAVPAAEATVPVAAPGTVLVAADDRFVVALSLIHI